MLLVKLLFTPLLMGVATLVARRWGPVVGGVFTALPLMSGPISLFLLLEQGPAFAAGAARASILGFVAVTAYALAFARLSRVLGAAATMVCCSAVFFAVAWLLSLPPLGLTGSLVAASALLGAGLAAMGPPPAAAGTPAAPWWDLPVRVAAAAAMVLGVTGLARALGPEWSGFLATFPVFTALMAAFTQWESGHAAAVLLVRGVILGMFGTAAFFYVVGLCVENMPPPAAYGLATAVNLAINAAVLAVLARRHGLRSRRTARDGRVERKIVTEKSLF